MEDHYRYRTLQIGSNGTVERLSPGEFVFTELVNTEKSEVGRIITLEFSEETCASMVSHGIGLADVVACARRYWKLGEKVRLSVSLYRED